jgi:hypothetical protein
MPFCFFHFVFDGVLCLRNCSFDSHIDMLAPTHLGETFFHLN